MARKNPNSSIRSGYRYEDLYVLQLCVEWLSDPEKFNSVKIQYAPDDTKGFAIDDIVVDNADGSQNYYQLKYKQNPAVDKWDFVHLIDKGLFRWITSYKVVNDNPSNVYSLITNGETDHDVQSCLTGDKLDLLKIQKYYPEIEQKLRQQFIENNGLLEDFFSDFKFIFNYSDKYELEDKLRIKLYDELKVTKAGVDSLLLYIGIQGSEQYPKSITLNEIRKHLSWDNPRPLNQNFQIPSDFQFFNRHTHQQIQSELKKPEGGTRILIGKPGAGKSTYLSKLYEVLEQDHIAVFRHHYHLNPKDQSHFERLNTDRVKEALRAAFKKEKSKVLKELSSVNTEHTPLREFISKIATYYAKQGKSFVLIIDGLDHVIREGNSEAQLQEFINEIFYPQPGYWLVLGTQEVAIKSLPSSVLKACPEDSWIEIKGLNKINVSKIIKTTLQPDKKKNEKVENEFINKVFNITSGNPLHLRYVLGEVYNSGELINLYNLERIPPYRGDIKNYYEDIWRQLPDLAKTLCFAITALDFKLHKEQLVELSSYFTNNPADITKSLKEIKHLILSELSGISVYHNSFMVFIKEQPELEEQRLLLYRNIRSWLTDYNDENLKWSELVKIEYYLGNPLPLLSLDKDWLVKSYLECRDEDQIQNLLDLATEAAFKNLDFKKVIFFGEISSRFERRSYSLWDENLHKIWVTSFRNNPRTSIKYPDFSRLTHYQLKELLIALKERGTISEIPEAAFDRINILFQDRDAQINDIAEAWLEVLLNFENISDQKIIKFLKQFRKGDRSEFYYAFYVRKILENQDRFGSRLTALFKSKLTDQEKRAIGRVLIQHDLRNGYFDWKKRLQNYPLHNDYTRKIYNYLCNHDLAFEMSLSSRNEFADKYDISSDNIQSKELYFKHFFTSLFLTISNQPQQIREWLKIEDSEKQTRLLKAILQMGERLGKCYTKKTPVVIAEILLPLDTVPELDFYKDYSLYELRRSLVPQIIDEVIWLAHVFNKQNQFITEIQVSEIEILIKHPWYYQSNLFTLLLEKRVTLSSEAFSFFAKQELENLSNELIEFKDKTEKMANLAILADQLRNREILDLLLYRAAENLIAYGNHKDMLLYDILLGIEKLNVAGLEKGKELLRHISPYVYRIDKLTDGDETASFIYDYSAQLAKVDVPALYNFYLLSLSSRDYHLSENLFGDILHTLDFSDPLCKAIGDTAVGKDPYNELSRIASKDSFAKEVLNGVHNSLGKVDYSRKQEEETTSSAKEKSDSDNTYLKVKPHNLENYLKSIPGSSTFERYERSSFMLKWAKVWFRKSGSDKEQLITVLRKIIEIDFVEAKPELLDHLYPFALNTDRSFAFKCICWAQSNSGSWSSDYISRPEEARARWKKVISDFPSRLMEFFTVSVNNSGLRYNKRRKNYSISAPKTIQFFIDAGQVSTAEKVAGYYIDLLPNLFPDLNLPEPEFYIIKTEVELFDILLKRFEWLSPIAKERAAKQIVKILVADDSGAYHKKYLEWLKAQSLESRACEGLVVILLAVQTKDSSSHKYIDGKNLGGLLKVRCTATDLITEAIGSILNIKFQYHQPIYFEMSYGNVTRSKSEFLELVGNNLPLVYHNYIKELEEKSHYEVWPYWNALYDDYCNTYKLKYTRDDERYLNDYNIGMIGRVTIFAEVLRSTFFKLLDYLCLRGLITTQDLFEYSISNYTIEPSIWSLNLGTKPNWWPKLKGYHKLGYNEEIPKLNVDIEKLLSLIQSNQILYLNTILSQADYFYHGDYFYGLEVLPIAFSGEWGKDLKPDIIFRELEINSGLWFPRIPNIRNFGAFSNELKYYAPERSPAMHESTIIPLVAPLRPMTTDMFQYYRSFFQCKLLTPIIKDELELQIDSNRLSYIHNGTTISYYQDFLDGLRDSTEASSPLPYNNYLLINKDYLVGFLAKQGLNFAYVIKKTFFTKRERHSSRQFDTKDKYSFLNMTDKLCS